LIGAVCSHCNERCPDQPGSPDNDGCPDVGETIPRVQRVIDGKQLIYY